MTLPRHHADDTDCDNCGGRIDTRDWYPIETVVDDDAVDLYRFCDVSCREDWTDAT
jgi:hypothetical protein